MAELITPSLPWGLGLGLVGLGLLGLVLGLVGLGLVELGFGGVGLGLKGVFVFDSKSENRDRAVEAVESVSEARAV